MTSSEENVTTTPESKAIEGAARATESRWISPSHGRPNRNPCRRGRVRCTCSPDLFRHPFASSCRIAAQTNEPKKPRFPPSPWSFRKKAPPHRKLSCPAIRRHSATRRSMREPAAISSAGISTLVRMCRKNQLLAQIETPEVDQQLQQARADLHTAQANLNIAKITAARWQDLVSTGSVSQQETDQAVSNLSAVTAAAESSAANVRRLEQLQAFEKVYAPFDGIITARNTDIGALIDAGASTQPRQLFHIAAIRKLRLYVAVPEVYSRAARSGAPATLTLDEFPGQTFHGTLVRNANSIDIASRTLLVEVDVDNPTGQLLPGAYVFCPSQAARPNAFGNHSIDTLIFLAKRGLQVGLVRNGKAELVPVKIGPATMATL